MLGDKKRQVNGEAVTMPGTNTEGTIRRLPYRITNPGRIMGQARNENYRERLAKNRTKKKTNQRTIGPIIL